MFEIALGTANDMALARPVTQETPPNVVPFGGAFPVTCGLTVRAGPSGHQLASSVHSSITVAGLLSFEAELLP